MCVKLGMQNFSNLLQGKHSQIRGWMEGCRKFNRKLAIFRKR